VKRSLGELEFDAEMEVRLSQGLPLPLVDARVVEPGTTAPLPWDGATSGELQVRGPWVARAYYRTSESPSTEDGWLRTGDVATIDAEGYIRIVDRTKDLIKSGGEWISSVELENAIMGHPDVVEAAVVGVGHAKWGERPLACIVVRDGASIDRDELLSFLTGKVAKWWLPDDVVVIDAVPKTSVGKFDKKVLRERYRDHLVS
jgi:acyl-CoA synthetase (AMP-forming)/AMP-acid ligase II